MGLILLNGIFAGAEIAIVSVRRTRVRELAEEGSRSARAVDRLRSNPDGFFATVQIGITVVSATAAAIGGANLAAELAPPLRQMGLGAAANQVAFAVVVGGISYLSLVLGELVPKSLGLRFAEGYAMMIARPLVGLGKLARPLVWLLTASSNLVLRFFGDKTTFSEGRMSAEELQQLVEDAGRTGSVDEETTEIASRALELKDVWVGAVMVPRHKIVAIEREASLDEVREIVMESGHTRLPVKDGSLENLAGYIVAKDLLAVAWQGGPAAISDIVRPAYFVPESMKALDALREMQKRRLQLSIVVDERGSVAGLVTVEDLVEELVGEIVSEHELPVKFTEELGDGRYVVAGGTAIRDVNRELGAELPEADGYSTIAGLCLSLSGKIPARGETFTSSDGSELEILDATPRRIRRVAIAPHLPSSEVDRADGDGEEAAAEAPAAPH